MKQTSKGLILFMILDLVIGGACFGLGWNLSTQGRTCPTCVLQEVPALVIPVVVTQDNLSQLGEMTRTYHENHPYEAKVWDCSDMAPELWALATMAGFRAEIMVGNPWEVEKENHAWAVVEVEPGRWVALEGTNGHLYTSPTFLTGHPFGDPHAFVAWYSSDERAPKTVTLSPYEGDGEGWIRNLTPQ
jgi:hypothetical protein